MPWDTYFKSNLYYENRDSGGILPKVKIRSSLNIRLFRLRFLMDSFSGQGIRSQGKRCARMMVVFLVLCASKFTRGCRLCILQKFVMSSSSVINWSQDYKALSIKQSTYIRWAFSVLKIKSILWNSCEVTWFM